MSEIKNIDMPFTRHQFVYDVYNVEQFSFLCVTTFYDFCEAQARVRQGLARDDPQGERPQSLNPCLELTLKLVGTRHPPPPPTERLISLN